AADRGAPHPVPRAPGGHLLGGERGSAVRGHESPGPPRQARGHARGETAARRLFGLLRPSRTPSAALRGVRLTALSSRLGGGGSADASRAGFRGQPSPVSDGPAFCRRMPARSGYGPESAWDLPLPGRPLRFRMCVRNPLPPRPRALPHRASALLADAVRPRGERTFTSWRSGLVGGFARPGSRRGPRVEDGGATEDCAAIS